MPPLPMKTTLRWTGPERFDIFGSTRMPAYRDTLLKEILSQPSAPFREKHVIDTIRRALTGAKVPHFTDPVGNIVVGAASRKDYEKKIREKTKEPLRVFIAHMDHPGFIGTRWKSPI